MEKIIPGFHGGISQQVQELRLPNQLENAVNLVGDPVNGTRRRAPVVFHPTIDPLLYTQNIGALSLAAGNIKVVPFETDGYRALLIFTGRVDCVTGTDTKKYVCIKPHVATNDTKPVTGASYADYWQEFSGTPVNFTVQTWTLGAVYDTPIHVECGDATGLPENVTYMLTNYGFEEIMEYLAGSTTVPSNLHVSQILDTLILTNRSRAVANGSTYKSQDGSAYLWVSRGAANTTYTVNLERLAWGPVGGVFMESSTAVTTTITTGAAVTDTAAIAIQLATALDLAITAAGITDLTVYSQGAMIAIVPSTSTGVRATVNPSDGLGGTALRAISTEAPFVDGTDVHSGTGTGYRNAVQSVVDLPPGLPNGIVTVYPSATTTTLSTAGRVVKIRGTSGLGYYVEFDATSNSWKESVSTHVYATVDPGTLPIRLTFDGIVAGEATFAFSLMPVEPRIVGDLLTCPDPSFVGKTIDGTFFSNNRLGFFYADSVFLSRIGDYYNFYPSTAQEVLDDDPIDITVDSGNNRNVYFRTVKGFNGRMLFFSDSGEQYELTSGQQAMTPTTAQLTHVSSFKVEPTIEPEIVGNRLYFIEKNDSGGYSLKMIQDTTDGIQVSDLSTAVPRLILAANLPNLRICGFPGSSGILLASPNILLEYRFMYNDAGERLSSTWWKHQLPTNTPFGTTGWWTFSDEIVGFYEIYRVAQGYEWLPIRYDPDDETNLNLDLSRLAKDAPSIAYNAGNDTTEVSWTASGKMDPYADPTTLIVVDDRTLKMPEYSVDGAKLVFPGDLTATGDLDHYVCGLVSRWTMQLSDILERTNEGIAIPTRELHLKYIQLEFINTGEFRTYAQGKTNQKAWEKQFWSNFLNLTNTGQFTMGDTRTSPSVFRMPVFTKARGATITITGNTYLPAQFIMGVAECD